MAKQLQNNHRGATENLVALAIGPPPQMPSGIRAIGVDENLNKSAIEEAVSALIREGIADTAFPLWSELRRASNGQLISAIGAPEMASSRSRLGHTCAWRQLER